MKTGKLLGILLISAMALGGCAEEAARQSVVELQESALYQPQKTEVVRGDMCIATYYDAYVGPKAEQLTFEDEGVFGEFHVKLGDVVKEGDVLATPALESIEKEIEKKEKEIDNLTGTFNYKKASLENSIAILRAQLDNQYTIIDTYEYLSPEFTEACRQAGSYDEQRKRLELQLKQLQETYELELPYLQKQLQKLRDDSDGNAIVAPFDGTIIALAEAEYGNKIDTNKYYVALADISVTYARCAMVSASALNKLEAVTFWKDGKEYETTEIPMDYDYYLATRNSNEEAYSEFEIMNAGDEVAFGDYGKIKLITETKKDVLYVPETALQLSGGNYFVYMDVDGKREQVAVKTGVKDGINVEILEGLKEGDVVYVQE